MKAGWEIKKLGEVCEFFGDGDWIESKDQSDQGIRLIQTGNVGEGVFKDRSEKARYISEATFKRLRCTEIVEGDCLISRLPDPVGRSCLIPKLDERLITAVDCTIARFKGVRILPNFFVYYSQSTNYISWIDSETTGTTRKRISRSKLGETPIPIPPLSEQEHIVGILDEAFASIATAKANTQKNLENAKAVFESHLNSVFSKRGEGWVEKKLGDVCDRVSVGHVGITSPHYRDHGVLFLRTQNVGSSGINFKEVKFISPEFHASLKKSEIKGGDVIISRIITHTIHCGIIPDDLGPANCANVVLVRPSIGLNSEFLAHYIKSPQAQNYLLDRKVGSAQLVVNTNVIKSWPIPVPPLSEQAHVVETLDNLRDEISRLTSLYTQKLTALEDLKKSLLHQAFTGNLY
jgi:type I restriction enzyme S subunit